MLLTRPLVTAGISFLTTAMVVSFFSSEVSFVIGVALFVLLLIALIVFGGKKRINVAIVLLSGIVATTSYGIFASNEYDMDKFDLQTGMITGVVTDISPAKNSKTAYTLKVTKTTIEDMSTPFRAIIYIKSDVLIDFYDTIKIEAKARKITPSPSFNSEQYYRAKGISMTFSSYENATVLENGKHGIMYYAKHLNVVCSDMIDRYVERPYAGLLKAMLLGNNDDIDDIAYNSITRAGVSHVFVVSGLHVSMLAMMAFFILRLFRLSLGVRSIVTIFVAWGFVAITGFGIPAIRAGIMLTVLMGANLFQRKSDTLTSLFLSGIIIVLINPISIVDASFLLTFTATLGIVLFARPIGDFLCRTFNIKPKVLKYFVDIIAVTLAANLAMLPVIIYTFKGISVGALLTNIAVIPLLPIILVVCLILLCFAGIPFVAVFFGGVIEFLLKVILKTCEVVSSFAYGYIGLNYNFVYLWLGVSILLIVIAAVLIKQKQVTINVLFLSFAGLLLCFGFNGVYNRDNVELTTINSFEAQRIVITYNDRATVIAFEDDSRIDVDVESYLRSKNIHKVENYIFTSSEKKDISDTEFLTATTDTYNVYLPNNDKLLPYANDSFKPINGVYPLKPNGGYDILSYKGTAMSVDRFDSGILISLIVGQTKIAITNSPQIASEADCDILYYCGKFNEKLTQNRAKCVILLSRFELDRLADKLNSTNAYEKPINLTVRQNGAYKIDYKI
ncbi:MAG: ComEC/Rec2 family competence protein [Oscillospiraceae bacterium]